MKRNAHRILTALLVVALLLGTTSTAIAANGLQTTTYSDSPSVYAVSDVLDLMEWDPGSKRFVTKEQDIEPTKPAFAETNTGGVVGYKYDGVNYFYGVPYAQAERFMPAKAAEKWNGYLPSFVHGEVAPQAVSKNLFDFMNYSDSMVINEEKMLNLNIQTPDLAPAKLKPVVVWLHGGGLTGGSSADTNFYDGGNFAKSGDVVFVSPNHRLNVLGYLDLSAYGEEYKYSGNLGISDIVFALQWVKDNIKNFGGDPNNVTIVGQSGGGTKVTTLMGVPAAKGLFHKAVALSGGAAKVTRTTEIARAQTAEVLKKLKISAKNIKDLKTVPYADLLAAFNAVIGNARLEPVVDGDYYPDGTYAISKNIPFMCGNVLGEFSTNVGGMVVPVLPSEQVWHMANDISAMPEAMVMGKLKETYGANADAIAAAFKKAYPTHKLAEIFYINNRMGPSMTAEPLAAAMESYGGTVYHYMQAYNYPMMGGVVSIHTASCIPFWFDNIDMINIWVAGDVANARKVSREMSTALANFARTGNPSQTGLKWVPWTAKDDAVMVFDVTSGIRNHHEDELFTLMLEGKK